MRVSSLTGVAYADDPTIFGAQHTLRCASLDQYLQSHAGCIRLARPLKCNPAVLWWRTSGDSSRHCPNLVRITLPMLLTVQAGT